MTLIVAAMIIGAGATLVIDLWAMLLKRAFGVPSLNLCLLGRWLLHMPTGTFAHSSIATAANKPHECKVGWTAHYLIGMGFAVLFLLIGSSEWLARPTLPPALAFGIVTVLVPFLTLQPAFGLGIASSKTPHPYTARLRSLATHTIYGMGLWLWAVLLAPFLVPR